MEYYAHYDKDKDEKQLLEMHLNSVAKLAIVQIPSIVHFEGIFMI
jgi:hypothetical protein